MCLSVAIRYPNHVLETGNHLGYEWTITTNNFGCRCGYIRVPLGHPWHGVHYGDINAEVHGGLTFSDADTPCGKGSADDGYWVGFDCSHAWDAADPDLIALL